MPQQFDPQLCGRNSPRAVPRSHTLVRRIAGITLMAGALSLCPAQSAPPPVLNPDTQGKAIIAHLNSVIQYYRSVNQPIQRAGEPNDVVYRDQAVGQAAEIARYAFESARTQATLLAAARPGGANDLQSGEQQRMQATAANVAQRIADIQGKIAQLDKQIGSARARDLPGLQARRRQLQQALELSNAMKEALGKITGMAGGTGVSGLAGNVDRLQRTVPELQTNNKTSVPQITTVDPALSAGLTTQASVLFELLQANHAVQNLLDQENTLHNQATDLRSPLSTVLRSLIRQGQQLTQDAEQAPPPSPAPAGKQAAPVPATAPASGAESGTGTAGQPDLRSITTRFKSLSAATVPLSQEIIVLEQSRGNLSAWRTSLTSEYRLLLHAILLRVLIIGLALIFIVGGGQLWTRAANRYIREIRRRRQILIIRRVVVGFLSVLVVLFGFVTQFHSLATFAGFITAGIAVGLQTILLSVAAYFFIIGRYGIKVGDRITIGAVTGDVIDVGLVRFYVMELAGSATELKPTGRVVVFSNAVLFQAGMPLFKQLPGTDYAWHELVVQLADSADYRMVCGAIVDQIRKVYEGYRGTIIRQHQVVQNWMQTSIDNPEVESRLQLSGGAFQLWARFPVEIRNAAQTDEEITRALLDLMGTNPEIKAAISGMPAIQASVRG